MKRNRATLPTFVHSLWMRIISAPAAVKLVGLAVLPVATIIISAWLYAEIFIFRLLAASPDITLNAHTLFDLSWRAFLWLGLGALIGIGASVTLTWVLIRQLGGLLASTIAAVLRVGVQLLEQALELRQELRALQLGQLLACEVLR